MAIYKHGNWWWYDFTFDGRRFRSKAGRTKTEAERMEAKIRSEAIAGYHNIQIKKTNLTIEQFAKIYLARRIGLTQNSRKRDSISVKHLLNFFSGVKLKDIKPNEIEDYKVSRREEGVANATINRELAALRTLFNCAKKWKDSGYNLDYNPMDYVDMLKEPPGRTRYLSKEEIVNLLDACPSYFLPIVVTALNTGMRLEEILSLRWKNIFLNSKKNPYIEVEKSKNNKKRLIPLNEQMITMLEEVPQKNEFVFLNQKGTDRLRNVRKPFSNSLKKAGIKNFRFHDLRHTFASYFIMSGGDLLSLKEILGHQSLAMVERYSHLAIEHKANQINRIYNPPHNSHK